MSLWPLDPQGAPGMGDVVLQAPLSFTPRVLLPWGQHWGWGGSKILLEQ